VCPSTTMVGCTMPVPRSAEPIATSANCSASPGVYQYRYAVPAAAAAVSAATQRTYAPPASQPHASVSTPQSAESSTDWLKTRLASAWSLRPAA